MDQGQSDESIVAVKLDAEDTMVTWLRTKHRVRDRDVKGEGRNM